MTAAPRLKQLTLQGFKSFADPTTLRFPGGITAIVGPNGSGKSNIADAVRWVLGEQRMLTLRGRSGEDMIFAGSKRRARAGMARVALLFDNGDHWLPLDFEEVAIERRIYRDGRSEYRLNGRRIRLGDLRDMLDRAGLGREAYFTIGQGVVDRILSLRAGERLAIFEQAAGIAPYRRRREEALRRLDETSRNVDRVRDILAELEPRLHRLERQVRRLKERTELETALRERLRLWYGYRWGEALNALESARQKRAYLAGRVARQQERLETAQERLNAERRRLSQLRTALTQLHHESSARHRAAERAQRELAVTQERRRLLQERLEEERANLAPLLSALAEHTSAIEALERSVEEAQTALEAARGRLEALAQVAAEASARRRALVAAQAAAQARAVEAAHRLEDRRERLRQAEEALVHLREERAALEEEEARLQSSLRQAQNVVEAARAALAAREEAVRAAEQGAEEAAQQVQQHRARLEALQRTLAEAERRLEALSTRLALLERIESEGEGLYAGVRAVLQAVRRGELDGLPGTVAALIDVPARLERAVETALGGRLQSIIAERWEAAQAAIAYLKQHAAGRATFLPLDTLRPPSPLRLPADEPGVIGVAADLVGYDPSLEAAVRLLLGRVVVVETLETARRLHRRLHGSFQIVTLDGEVLRSSGALTGGRRGQSRGGLLARRRELRRLPQAVAEAEAAIADLREQRWQAEKALRTAEEALRQAQEAHRQARRARREAEGRLDEAVRKLEARLRDRGWLEGRRAALERERAQAEARREALREAIAEAEAALREAEGAAREAAAALQSFTDADESSRQVERARGEVARAEGERATAEARLEARRAEARRLRRQVEGTEARIAALETELAALSERLVALQQAYAEARAAAERDDARLPQLEAEVAEAERRQEALEAERRRAQEALGRERERLTAAEVALRRHEDGVAALRREIEEALGLVIADLPDSLSLQQPLPMAAIVSPLPAVLDLPPGLEAEIRDLRTQVRRLGLVDPAVEEEHAALAERYTFLSEQLDDLQAASAHLRTVIGELDAMMKERFGKTFRDVASAFSRTFRQLFNGGTARLEAVADERGETVGVEIVARPPGKRTSGLGMLSGGERTLTAIALLFALMSVSPTPFCILDEVDAMLDEANVGRFRTHLEALAQRTQFIVITHNRGTVEAAETIYGISMGDDGVSQVLSLRLDDLPEGTE